MLALLKFTGRLRQSVDVNRSPTKDDIKFEYEQQIWPILQAAVKAALKQILRSALQLRKKLHIRRRFQSEPLKEGYLKETGDRDA